MFTGSGVPELHDFAEAAPAYVEVFAVHGSSVAMPHHFGAVSAPGGKNDAAPD
jgi:hypothetical protein